MSQSKPVIFLAFANDEANYLRNLREETRVLLEILAPAEKSGLIEVVHRTNCTAKDIFDIFQDEKYCDRIAIFHYAGHANSYQLLLESVSGENAPANADGLAEFLAQQNGLHLVFLNGCLTVGHAQGLLDAGIPTVIATTMNVGDQDCREFASVFYRGLTRGAGDASIGRSFKEAEGAFLAKSNQDSDKRGLSFGTEGTDSVANQSQWVFRFIDPPAENWSLRRSLKELTLAQWHRSLAALPIQFRSNNSLRESVVESPLWDDWTDFCSAANWKDKMRELILECEQHPRLVMQINRLLATEWSLDYWSIWSNLKPNAIVLGRDAQSIIDQIHREKDERRRNGLSELTDEKKQELKQAFAARDLADAIQKSPLFARCFLVLGSFGSGKSHMVSRVLSEAPNQSMLVALLNVDESVGDLDKWLLGYVEDKTGVEYENLDELNRIFVECDLKLLVVIDDLHRALRSNPRFLKQVTDWIRGSTRYERFSWLLTSQDSFFDLLLLEQNFWSTHSAYRTGLAGWISLDLLNRELGEETGVAIVEKSNGNSDFIDAVFANEELQRRIASPLMAWLYLDLVAEQKDHNIASLNTTSFYVRQWVEILKNRPIDRINEGQLKDACKRIAAEVVDTRSLYPSSEKLLSKGSPRQNWEDSPFGILEEMGLIRRRKDESNDLSSDSTVELRFENLWNRWIANEVRISVQESKGRRLLGKLTKWFGKFQIEFVREGVWEFLLLESNAERAKEQSRYGLSELAQDGWEWGLKEPSLPKSAVFFASVQSSKSIRETVLTRFLKLRPKLSDRELFSLCYFVQDGGDLSPIERIRAFRGLHPQLSQSVLISYYCHVVEQVLDTVEDSATLVTALHELAECFCLNHPPGDLLDQDISIDFLPTERIANCAFETLLRLQEASLEPLIETVRGYIDHEWGNGVGSNNFMQWENIPKNQSWFLHDWMAEQLCDHVLKYSGPKSAFNQLLGLGWYDGTDKDAILRIRSQPDLEKNNIDFHIRALKCKQKQANLAFGRWYRRASHGFESFDLEQSEFVQLCTDIFHLEVDGRPLPPTFKRAAFFMVKHTVPRYFGQPTAPRVHQCFHGLIEEMRRDDELNDLMREL